MKFDTKKYTKQQKELLDSCDEVSSLIQIVRLMRAEVKYPMRYISTDKLDSIQQHIYKLKYYIKNGK